MSCQEPDSNPYSFGFLFSHFLTVLKMDPDSLHFLPLCFLLNRPFSPRFRIRTSQSRTVEYGMPSSLQISLMPWPLFLKRHASSLSFARVLFSLSIALVSLFMLTLSMNLHPDSSFPHSHPDLVGRSASSEPHAPSPLCFFAAVAIIEVQNKVP